MGVCGGDERVIGGGRVESGGIRSVVGMSVSLEEGVLRVRALGLW